MRCIWPHDLARVVVRPDRARLLREREARRVEGDLAALVLHIELDRVQPDLRQRLVLRELPGDRGERPGDVDTPDLDGQRPRADRDLERRRSVGGRRGAVPAPALLPFPAKRHAAREREHHQEEDPGDHGPAAPLPATGCLPARAKALVRVERWVQHGHRTPECRRSRRSGTACCGLRSASMVLSDRAIRRLIEAGRIGIDPYDPALMQPSSLDVRVDRLFRVFRNSRYPYIDVKAEQEGLTELVEVEDDEPFILHPGEFVLGSTLERVRLPDDLVARLEGKSSLGRLGLLIHSTAGLHRPRLRRARDARAVERRQPADHDLSGDEDRPALVRADVRAGGDAVRLGRARVEVPGPARARLRAATGRTSRTSDDPRHRCKRLRRSPRRARARRGRHAGAGDRAERARRAGARGRRLRARPRRRHRPCIAPRRRPRHAHDRAPRRDPRGLARRRSSA